MTRPDVSVEMAYAVTHDDAPGMLELIARGEPLTVRDRSGNTLLHIAAANDSAACVGALLDAGAEVDSRNGWGNTPLGMALFSFRGNGSVINQLLEHGADPDIMNNSGNSPRQTAGLIADVDVARFFRQDE